jgi:hypothetical protein
MNVTFNIILKCYERIRNMVSRNNLIINTEKTIAMSFSLQTN